MCVLGSRPPVFLKNHSEKENFEQLEVYTSREEGSRKLKYYSTISWNSDVSEFLKPV